MAENLPWLCSVKQITREFFINYFKGLGTHGLRSLKRNTGECLSKTVVFFFVFLFCFFYLLNNYCKPVSCDLQLESSSYFRIRDLTLDRINY